MYYAYARAGRMLFVQGAPAPTIRGAFEALLHATPELAAGLVELRLVDGVGGATSLSATGGTYRIRRAMNGGGH